VPFAERPAGARLLADLARGDRLLVTKIDRAARNTLDLLGLVKRVQGIGADVVFVESKINTDGPMGEFLLTMLGAVAQFEAALIAERRRESLAVFADEGRHAVGKAPLGLVSAPNAHGRGLVLRPDPVTAPLLRDVVDRILAGRLSQADAARTLDDGVKARVARLQEEKPDAKPYHKGMTPAAFGRLLRNTRLVGVGPNGDLDPEAAVFSLLEWDELQEFLRRPEKTWTRSDDFGTVLLCGVCGERMYYQKAANLDYSTYKCRRALHVKGKPSASVTRSKADDHVERDFLATFGHLDVMREERRSTSDARARAVATARLQHAQALRALDDAEEVDAGEAFAGLQRAKRTLRLAEAMPDETVVEHVPTGEDFAHAWRRLTIAERADLIQRSGVRYIVEPGRLPIEEKVHLSDHGEPDYLAGQTD
jgi:DNA invertase Pin-like site-specific DNA recombinase